jgi:hypothetical protein
MRHHRISLPQLLRATLPVAFLVGCGAEQVTFPAGGTVKFADGTPLVGCLVEFQLAESIAAPTAKGTTGPDGDFQLGTYEDGDGALLGPHRVMIMAPPPAMSDDWEKKLADRGGRPAAGAAKRPEMDLRYRSYGTSGLSYTVTEDVAKNHFEIVVDAL